MSLPFIYDSKTQKEQLHKSYAQLYDEKRSVSNISQKLHQANAKNIINEKQFQRSMKRKEDKDSLKMLEKSVQQREHVYAQSQLLKNQQLKLQQPLITYKHELQWRDTMKTGKELSQFQKRAVSQTRTEKQQFASIQQQNNNYLRNQLTSAKIKKEQIRIIKREEFENEQRKYYSGKSTEMELNKIRAEQMRAEKMQLEAKLRMME
ncbi:Hypothetical_protein [Hexamita inflata]|uniref:Hypothetical_protein n=1 Tax=Hexamita inflata TaxID=28002 RepID=A0AA86VR05_9EUKA|nr:Hypothetical protein HINF_LOCUS61773 [Hexamita inflata]